MSEEVSSMLKIPVFNREDQNSQSWMISPDLPTGEEEIGMLNATNANDKKKIATGEQNVLAMVHLTM
eukprot:271958-Ditylum_brightwellii.AAC.1